MDPISTTASLITLIATTRTVVQTTVNIYKSIDGAPKALTRITKQVTLVQHLLEYIERTCSGNQSCLPSELQAMLTAALLAVAERVEELERVSKLRHRQSSIQIRLRWALLEKAEALEIMQMLQQAKTDLGHVVQLLHLHMCLCRPASTFGITSTQQANSCEPQRLTDASNGDTSSWATELDAEEDQSIAEHKRDSDAYLLPQESKSRESRHVTRTIYDILSCRNSNSFESSGFFTYNWDQYKTTYALSLHLRLPGFLRYKALNLAFMARQNASYWLSLSLLHGTMGVSNLVPCKSEIWPACLSGDVRAVRDLICSRRASVWDIFDRCNCILSHPTDSPCCGLRGGDTVLLAATLSGQIALVRYLLNMGADVNALGAGHKSCLKYAFEYGYLDIARLLVGRGASLDHIDSYGRTVLHGLSAKYRRFTPYPLLAKAEYRTHVGLEFLDFLATSDFEHFAALDNFNNPPLLLIARMGMSQLCLRLLQLGASAKISGNMPIFGMGSLIHSAAWGGNIPVVDIVLAENPGLDINLVNHLGRSPLHDALSSGGLDTGLVEYLLDRGADVNQRDSYGRSGLFHLVARTDEPPRLQQLFETLLKHGGKLDTKDCIGNTLLHHAARFGNITLMETLLEKGCEINAQNLYHLTPLHYAGVLLGLGIVYLSRGTCAFLERTLSQAVNLLLTWGANPNISGSFVYHDIRPGLGANDDRYPFYMDLLPSNAKMTPAGFANFASDTRVGANLRACLLEFIPHLTVDDEGDLFWDADEYLECPGYGSEYLIVSPKDSTMDEAELLRRIWEDHGCSFYTKYCFPGKDWLWDGHNGTLVNLKEAHGLLKGLLYDVAF